jgi:putative transposase
MYGAVRRDIREIITTLCGYKEVEIVAGNVRMDHVHLCVKIPPKISVSEFMGYLKGKSALMIFDKHPEYKQKQGRTALLGKRVLCGYRWT